MASRRFASAITFSAGTNTNSASLSTNFLMSHGQATRSTLTFSRVIHFITVLLVLLFFPLLPARCTPSSAFAPLHAVSYSAAAPSAQFWRGGSAVEGHGLVPGLRPDCAQGASFHSAVGAPPSSSQRVTAPWSG